MPLTNTPIVCQEVKSLGRTSTNLVHGVEKASQTYLQGAFLIDDDAGRITESASPIDGSAVTKRTLGLSLQAATGTTGNDVPFDLVGEHAVYKATLSDATAGTHTLAQASQWQTYPITKDSVSGHWYLDANAVSDTGGGLVINSLNGFATDIGTVDAVVLFIVTTPARGTANAGSANI